MTPQHRNPQFRADSSCSNPDSVPPAPSSRPGPDAAATRGRGTAVVPAPSARRHGWPAPRGFLRLILLALCACLGLHTPAGLAADLAPSVTTDLQDYPYGGTVYITGQGFLPNETVQCQVVHADGATVETDPDHQPWLVTADENGRFDTTWYVGGLDDIGATLQLTAVGQTSGAMASATFTDAFGIAKLHIGTSTGAEDYIFTAGDTVVVEYTVDPRDSGHPNRSHRIIIKDGSGAVRNVPVCIANTSGSLFYSYTIQPNDPPSTAADWTATLEQLLTADCSGAVEKTSS